LGEPHENPRLKLKRQLSELGATIPLDTVTPELERMLASLTAPKPAPKPKR
jgi:hypothetical protein